MSVNSVVTDKARRSWRGAWWVTALLIGFGLLCCLLAAEPGDQRQVWWSVCGRYVGSDVPRGHADCICGVLRCDV